MSRFVLIDPSLRDARGHHDSYARQMLRAAERFGYHVTLAANRSYEAAPLPPTWQLERVFDHAVYDDPLLMPDWGDASPRGKALVLRNFAERWQAWRLAGRRRRIAASHAIGFHALFDRIQPEPGDQFLLAAASELLLAGLAAAAAGRDPRFAAVEWHAVFHFNNFVGTPDEYAPQACRRARLSRVLAECRRAFGAGRLHLYATTGELAAELSSLGVLPVRELGYPIDSSLRTCGRQPRRAGPLRVTFAGDGRLEKGFHHLPAIVDAVLANAELASQVEFVIQANFPFRLPCRRRNRPLVAARDALARHDPSRVRLLCQPLDDAAYRQLILDADLLVLPYDARHYFARCSGVLVEALCAGVPVIAPAGCSMAAQLVRSFAPPQAAADDDGPGRVDCAGGGPPGLVASSPAEIPTLVRQIVVDYDRYRRAAARFAAGWTRWHHPARIVAELLNGATTLDAAELLPPAMPPPAGLKSA